MNRPEPQICSRPMGGMEGDMKILRRNAIIITVILFVCAAVYLNWAYNRQEAQLDISSIRVDGGPTANQYLMQFQSSIANCSVQIPELQELSGMGAAYMAGIAAGLYDENQIYDGISYTEYQPRMEKEEREKKAR